MAEIGAFGPPGNLSSPDRGGYDFSSVPALSMPAAYQGIRDRRLSMFGVTPQEMVAHEKFSATKNLPFTASPQERNKVAYDKMMDLLGYMNINPGSVTSKVAAVPFGLGALAYQGAQGVRNVLSGNVGQNPNFHDFMGGLRAIQDFAGPSPVGVSPSIPGVSMAPGMNLGFMGINQGLLGQSSGSAQSGDPRGGGT